MKTVTICIANHKGGVGKTTTTVNAGAGLAALGLRVILVDCDIQSHVAAFLDLEPRPALYDLVVEKAGQEALQEVPGFDGLAVITGNEETMDVNRLMAMGRRLKPATALRDALATLAADVIIIDTAPSVSEIQFSALSAADWLVIPALPEYASEAGIVALTNMAGQMRTRGLPLQLMGVLPTMVQTRRSEHRETILNWRERMGSLLLPAVRNLTELAEAPGRGRPIWDYAPRSEGAKDYAKVLASIRKRVGLNGKAKR